MKTKFAIIVAIIAALIAGAAAYRWRASGNGDPEPEETPAARVPTVRTVRVNKDTLERVAFVTGTVEPDFSSEVIAEISGEVEKLRFEDGTPVEEGLEVERGQRLALVDRKHQRAKLREAKAALDEARSALRDASIQKKDAEREKRRMVSLYEKGSVTEREKDQAVTAYERAEANVDLSEKRIAQGEAAVESAVIRYEDATKTAPIRGIISQKYVDEGSFVTEGKPIVRILNMKHVEVVGALAERHLPQLEAGQTPVRLSVDAYPGEELEGKIERVQPELDPLTRTVKVTVRLPNEEQKLYPGMFARAEIITQRSENVPVVPDAALMQQENGYEAFVITDGVAVRTEVSVGLKAGDRYEVKSGLTEGDAVVTRGHHLLEDGMEVETLEEEQK